MKRVLQTLGAVLLGAWVGLIAGCGAQSGAGKSIVLAEVGDQKITSADLDLALGNLPDSYRSVAETERGKRQILDNLVKKALLVQEAKDRGVANDPKVKHRIKEFQIQASERVQQQMADLKRRSASLDQQVFDNIMLTELNNQLKADTTRLDAVTDPDIEAYYKEYVRKLKVLNPAAQAPALAAVEDKIRAILVEEQLLKQLQEKHKVVVKEDAFRQRYGEQPAASASDGLGK